MDVVYRLTFEAAGTDLVGSKDFAELAAVESFVRESPHKPLKLVRIETTTTDVTDALADRESRKSVTAPRSKRRNS